MNPQALANSAAQSKAQGNQMLASDKANVSKYTQQYGNYQKQSNVANQNLSKYTDYMKNAGNPLNLYNTGISQAQQSMGFDPATLATATQNLTRSQNALQALNQASQSSTGGYGLSGAQLGNFYGSQAQPLANQIGAQNTAVGNLQQLYQNSLTQGQQGAQLGFQGEQQVSSNLSQVFQNANTQAEQAKSNIQFYSQLAQQQGGLNAQQQQYYAQSISALQSANAAMVQANAAAQQAAAQSALIGQQTISIQQANNTAKKAGVTTPTPKPSNISLQGNPPSFLQGSTPTTKSTVGSLLQGSNFSNTLR